MTRRQKINRCIFLRGMLTVFSHDGWRYAHPTDYLPLERELRELEDQLRATAPGRAR